MQATRYTVFTVFNDGHRNICSNRDIRLYEACVGLRLMGGNGFFRDVDGNTKISSVELCGTDGTVVSAPTWEELVERMETMLDSIIDTPPLVSAMEKLDIVPREDDNRDEKPYVVVYSYPTESYYNGPGTGFSYCMCKGVEAAEAKMQEMMKLVDKKYEEGNKTKPTWESRSGHGRSVGIVVDFGYIDTYYGHSLYAVASTNGEFTSFEC